MGESLLRILETPCSIVLYFLSRIKIYRISLAGRIIHLIENSSKLLNRHKGVKRGDKQIRILPKETRPSLIRQRGGVNKQQARNESSNCSRIRGETRNQRGRGRGRGPVLNEMEMRRPWRSQKKTFFVAVSSRPPSPPPSSSSPQSVKKRKKEI